MNYTWGFPALNVVFSEDNLSNVIQSVSWTLTATDAEYSANCYGSIGLGSPNPASFTPYEQVTEAQVQSWTIEALGQERVDSLMANLAEQIEQQKNPTSGNLPPPWISNEAE